jgi:hypothetical protein
MKSVQAFLKASKEAGEIFVTHNDQNGPCGYLYVSDEETLQKSDAYPVTAQDMYDIGLLEWDAEGQGWLMDRRVFIPANYDFRKIRRRLEDCLRKTTDEGLILELALRLNLRID